MVCVIELYSQPAALSGWGREKEREREADAFNSVWCEKIYRIRDGIVNLRRIEIICSPLLIDLQLFLKFL